MSAKSLFELAREDGPSTDAKDAMWSRVAATTTTAATAVASAAKPAVTLKSVAPVAHAASPKLVAIGGVIGVCGAAIGVVVTLLAIAPSREAEASRAAARTLAHHEPAAGAHLAMPAARKLDTASLEPVRELDEEPALRGDVERPAPPPAPDPASAFALEAKLVSDARSALVRGDAATALGLVKRTEALPTRALEPEELGIEARALRALGRADEAAATELALKRRFPDSALAR